MARCDGSSGIEFAGISAAYQHVPWAIIASDAIMARLLCLHRPASSARHGARLSLHRSTPCSPAMEQESTMAKQQVDDDQSWWPRIKDWLGILLVIVALVLVGWIFVLEGIH
jgi:hypothetical protein